MTTDACGTPAEAASAGNPACPERPSYVKIAARLTGRGLSDFDAVSWLHRTVRELTERDASLATLTAGEWEQLWARAGAASASDLKHAPERKAITWQV